ncbi:MAG: trehalose-phosphatase [Phycisphaerales bacterium]|nr:trehalose-phosphatase [Planctomycetota bacterium]
MTDLTGDIASLAAAPILLVATDFDGTLAELAPTPPDARVHRESLDALAELAALPRTFGVIVSGRALADLSMKVPDTPGVWLFGSHGAEGGGTWATLTDEQERTLKLVTEQCREIAERYRGAMAETKPYSVALHYRAVERGDLARLLVEIEAVAQRFPGAKRLNGIELSEFVVVDADKGWRLNWLRMRTGARRTVFLGDDVTDEAAFSALTPQDVGIKVGPGPSAAGRRVAGVAEVGRVLRELADARKAFLAGQRAVPIQQYALLADQRTAALVSPEGSIDWLCLPRLDSPSVFGFTLGDERHGRFAIAPEKPSGAARQAYVGDSLVVRTSWPEADVTDYFDCGEGRPFQRAGRTDLVRVVLARARVRVDFSFRPDFGRGPVSLIERRDGIEIGEWADPVSLYSPEVEWTIERTGSGPRATAILEPREKPYVLELRYGVASFRATEEESTRRARTAQYWSAWSSSLKLPTVAQAAVKRSALTLRALMYGPSGAIAAASTTSLPAPIGGERNWDYRYCWPRDACYAVQALLRLGNTGMPVKLLDWVCGVIDQLESPEKLRPIYSLAGRELGSEGSLPQMGGYLESGPVRIGNAAAHQVQLDVFGPIVDTVAKVAEAGAPVTPEYWRLASVMAEAVALRWSEPDHGIWEVRTPKRHHTHSRVMCWLALRRASTVAELVLGARRPAWDELAERIRQETLARSWNAEKRYFAAHLDGSEIDAAVLVMGLCGFLEPKDDRYVSTVLAVQRELQEENVVRRYLYDDGLTGIEGGFLLCTAWMIEALAMTGRVESARAMFEEYLKLQGPTGLMAEQWDPRHGVAMGNFPQAYSHIGLINCACTLSALAASESGAADLNAAGHP